MLVKDAIGVVDYWRIYASLGLNELTMEKKESNENRFSYVMILSNKCLF